MVTTSARVAFVAIIALVAIGCGSSEESVVGDAPITKGMPESQTPPPSAANRQAAAPRGNAGIDITK